MARKRIGICEDPPTKSDDGHDAFLFGRRQVLFQATYSSLCYNLQSSHSLSPCQRNSPQASQLFESPSHVRCKLGDPHALRVEFNTWVLYCFSLPAALPTNVDL
jgi:hypothetical protein